MDYFVIYIHTSHCFHRNRKQPWLPVYKTSRNQLKLPEICGIPPNMSNQLLIHQFFQKQKTLTSDNIWIKWRMESQAKNIKPGLSVEGKWGGEGEDRTYSTLPDLQRKPWGVIILLPGPVLSLSILKNWNKYRVLGGGSSTLCLIHYDHEEWIELRIVSASIAQGLEDFAKLSVRILLILFYLFL